MARSVSNVHSSRWNCADTISDHVYGPNGHRFWQVSHQRRRAAVRPSTISTMCSTTTDVMSHQATRSSSSNCLCWAADVTLPPPVKIKNIHRNCNTKQLQRSFKCINVPSFTGVDGPAVDVFMKIISPWLICVSAIVCALLDCNSFL